MMRHRHPRKGSRISHRIVVYCLLSCPIHEHLSYAFSPRLFGPSASIIVGRTNSLSTALKSSTQDITAKATNAQRHKRSGGGSRRDATKWIACSSTTEVTRAIRKYVIEGDAVAELGSQLRESSSALCEAIGPEGEAVLVDVERKFPKNEEQKGGRGRTDAMRREGDELDFYTDRATFVETRGFEFWREALFFPGDNDKGKGRQRCYDVLVVDVSTAAGNDLDLTCISLVREFMGLNNCISRQSDDDRHRDCRAVIVKSGALHDLARRLHHAQRIVSGAQSLHERKYHSSSSSSMIVGAVGVKQYRETIPHVVRKGDVCIEVGCHLGTTTTIIDEASRGGSDVNDGGCLGVDVGPNIIKRARAKYPSIAFEVGDGFKTGQLARMKDKHFVGCDTADDSGIYDVVYVDIGGLSGSEGLLEAISLLSSISNSLDPRCIVIKSLCVRRLASCLVPFSEVWRKERLSELTTKETAP